MRGDCVSETERREEEYRDIAMGWSNNALAFAGFAITEFVLITTLFTAFKVQANLLLELAIALVIVDAILFGFSSSFCTIASQPAHTLRGVKERRTGKPAAYPRQFFMERGERLYLAGVYLQTLFVCVFLVYLEMYWVLAIVVVVYALLYLYIMPITPYLWEKKEPEQK
jgi:hypothetical protein